MSNKVLIVAAGVIIVAICLWLLSDKQLLNSKSETIVKAIAILAPVATILALMTQSYSTMRRQHLDKRAGTLESNTRLWNELLDYMHANMDSIKPLYTELFPQESKLLDKNNNNSVGDMPVEQKHDMQPTFSTPITTSPNYTKISHKEIHVAHKIAQITEDFLEYEFPYEERQVWMRILSGWWKSPRLIMIWHEINYAYEDRTKRMIASLSQK